MFKVAHQIVYGVLNACLHVYFCARICANKCTQVCVHTVLSLSLDILNLQQGLHECFPESFASIDRHVVSYVHVLAWALELRMARLCG